MNSILEPLCLGITSRKTGWEWIREGARDLRRTRSDRRPRVRCKDVALVAILGYARTSRALGEAGVRVLTGVSISSRKRQSLGAVGA